MARGSDKAIFSMRGGAKSFGDKQVMRNVSFDVFEGEVVVLIGSSGSGKTTTLRCAALLETLDRGDIVFSGKKLCKNVSEGQCVYAKKRVLAKARAKYGFVFQHFNLFPHFNVYENITDSPIHVFKRERTEVDKEAKDIMRYLGLSGMGKLYPCELSGGQQQRVAIARSLIQKPEIVFLDEPTSALDPKSTHEVLNLIEQMALKNMTLVIVTHELGFARKVADRVIFMHEGLIAEQGEAMQIIDNPHDPNLRKFLLDFKNDNL